MHSWGLAFTLTSFLFATAIPSSAFAQSQTSKKRIPWELSAVINPRLTALQANEGEFSRATFLKSSLTAKKGGFGFFAEGFVEHDFAEWDKQPAVLALPELRKSRDTGYLQEAYLEYQYSRVSVRAGRQSVRWSQSWTLPSLDVFTARRWNRLFLDPLPEQLVHSDGVLLSYAASDIEADIFQVVQPAENYFPEPLPNETRKPEAQTGARVKARVKGFDVMLMGRIKPNEVLGGAALSYALDCCVLKVEGGKVEASKGFFIAGVDVFLGDFSFQPQATWFQDPVVTNKEIETIVYAPLRYTWGRTTFEAQYFRYIEREDQFASALISRDLGEWAKSSFKISAFIQNYEGRDDRLFGIYRLQTSGTVGGISLDVLTSL
jgi:hypothetical protein